MTSPVQIVTVGIQGPPGPQGDGVPTPYTPLGAVLTLVAGGGPGSAVPAWQAPAVQNPWAFHDYGNPASFPGSGLQLSLYTMMAVNFHGLSLDVPIDVATPGKRAILKLAMDSAGARAITLRMPDGSPIAWLGGTPAWSSGANQWDQVEIWTDGTKLYGKLLGLNTT